MPKTAKKTGLTVSKVLPWIYIIGGIIGLICSFAITFDEFRLGQNPNYIPSCNLNPIIACGSVMKSSQAKLFGFPNPWIGLAAFAVLVTVGVSMLAGAQFKRWYWRGLELGTILGVIFVHWLFFETVYHIHSLCPWCMVAWVVTITTFIYTTVYNLDAGHIKLSGGSLKIAKQLRKHHFDILVLWLLVLLALILKHFWYYYGKNI